MSETKAETNARIIALGKDGRPPREIAVIVGRNVATVRMALNRARERGETIPRVKRGRPVGGDDLTPAVSDLVARVRVGNSMADIIAATGRKEASISQALSRARRRGHKIPALSRGRQPKGEV